MLLNANCYGQGKPQKCLPLSRYDSLLVAVAEGTQAIIDAGTYKATNDKLKKEVDRKESVIVNQINKNKLCYALADSLTAQAKLKDEIIETQKSTIKKLGTKPKTWGVGITGGFGYGFSTEVKAMPFIGIGITKTFFRF